MATPHSYRNYRIIKHTKPVSGTNQTHEWVGLHEVYYENNTIVSWIDTPSAIGNDIDDLIGGLEYMIKDAKQCRDKKAPMYTKQELEKKISRL